MKRALFGLMLVASCASAAAQVEETVSFSSGDKVLQGMVYRPSGPGPLLAVLYNHGSALGMLCKPASGLDPLDHLVLRCLSRADYTPAAPDKPPIQWFFRASLKPKRTEVIS